MLVLSVRQEGERIVLTVDPSAEPTEITVMYVRRNIDQVRLGFDAPQSVRIMRAKLIEEAAADD